MVTAETQPVASHSSRKRSGLSALHRTAQEHSANLSPEERAIIEHERRLSYEQMSQVVEATRPQDADPSGGFHTTEERDGMIFDVRYAVERIRDHRLAYEILRVQKLNGESIEDSTAHGTDSIAEFRALTSRVDHNVRAVDALGFSMVLPGASYIGCNGTGRLNFNKHFGSLVNSHSV